MSRYNYACVCAHALASGAVSGNDVAVAQQECSSTLSQLIAAGVTSPEQIMGDPDFAAAKREGWFAPVLSSEGQQASASVSSAMHD